MHHHDLRVVGRDRPLSFHWCAEDFVQLLRLPAARNAHYGATVNAILAEAILAAEARQRVSYSAREGFYSQGRRYRGTSFTYTTVIAAIDVLHREGWITDCRVPPGNRGWQSSFSATEQLLDAWHGSADQLLRHHPSETIWLKDAAGNLVDYVDTPLTLKIRGRLEERNEALASVKVDVPGVEWRGHHMVFGQSLVLPIPGNPLRRIFSRGSWNLHGRAYGWFQSIPGTARLSATISGEPVAECDYSSMHATILYNKIGVAFHGDAYEICGYERAEAKAGFNIALSAKNDRAAVAALADDLGCDRRHAANIIAAIKQRHKPIDRYFCTDAGVVLMRTDSELILTALKVVNDAGDPALPVHDALVVPSRCAAKTEAAMVKSFEQIVGRASPCIIKTKGQNLPHMGERGGGRGRPAPVPPSPVVRCHAI